MNTIRRYFTIAPVTVALLCGCGSLSTMQVNEKVDATGKFTERVTTKTHVFTVFDAHNELAKFKTTQTDKTQGVGIGSLGQESSTTNAVQALQAIDSILGKVVK